MTTFQSLPAHLAPLPDGKSWVLLQELIYGNVTVPSGFVTDLASLPFFLRWWTDPWGRHGHAAIVHDWLYWSQRRNRVESDETFLRAMRVLRVRRTQRYALFLGVRWFGAWAWYDNRRKREAGFDKVLPDVKTPREHVERLWRESLEMGA